MSAKRPARPMVVAHRGASIEQPENTIAAFEAAIDARADAVEFDVRVTADGHAVVMHDPDVSRTTDGTGLVSELTLEEIRDLGVPTLEEALRCLSGRAAVDIEIKNSPDEPGYTPDAEPAVEATLSALDDVAFASPVIVSSFNRRSITHSRALRPDVPTGLLTWFDVDADDALARARTDGHTWVLPFVTQVLDADLSLTHRVHRSGLLLGVWIADDPRMARTLFADRDVDAVATNDPRTIVREAAPLQGREADDQLGRMIQLRSADWSGLYLDPSDDRLWKLSYPFGYLQGGGPPRVTPTAIDDAVRDFEIEVGEIERERAEAKRAAAPHVSDGPFGID